MTRETEQGSKSIPEQDKYAGLYASELLKGERFEQLNAQRIRDFLYNPEFTHEERITLAFQLDTEDDVKTIRQLNINIATRYYRRHYLSVRPLEPKDMNGNPVANPGKLFYPVALKRIPRKQG